MLDSARRPERARGSLVAFLSISPGRRRTEPSNKVLLPDNSAAERLAALGPSIVRSPIRRTRVLGLPSPAPEDPNQRRPFQRPWPRDQCQRRGPRGGGGRTSRRGGGIGGMAHTGGASGETVRKHRPGAAADGATGNAPETGNAMAARAAANILLRSSIAPSYRTEHCPIRGFVFAAGRGACHSQSSSCAYHDRGRLRLKEREPCRFFEQGSRRDG